MKHNYDSVDMFSKTCSTNSSKQGETSYTVKERTWLSFIPVFLMLFSFVFVQGQSVTNYVFSTTTTGSLALDANGNTVDMSIGTTQLVASGVDTSVSTVQAIGFDFIGMGTLQTNFSANSNGAMGLGNVAIGTSGTTNAGTATTMFIAPFGGDHATHATGKVHYKVVGSAPNRALVVEWLNMEMDWASSTSNGTYQVRIYETSGVIEFVYGAMSVADTFFTGPIIGFSAGTTAGKIASVTSSTNAVTTNGTAFINNTYVVGAIANLNSAADGSRRTYVFTPSTLAVAAPTTLTFSGITSAGTTVNWVDDSTNEFGFLVTRATDAAFTTNVVTATVASTTTAATGGAYNSIQTGLTPSTLYYYKVQALTEAAFSTEISGSQATNAPGIFISVANGNWTNPATWDANAVPTGADSAIVAAHTVTIDAASLSINNLTVQGSLEFGATPTTFNVNGNLTVEAGGEFLVFNGTTGKAIVVSGNIVNDGNIDLSIGATTEGSLTLNGSAVQSITGSGTFANNRIRNLIFSNTSTAIPNIYWDFDDISVEYNLTISNAKIDLGGNKINYGVSATSTGNTFAFTNGGFLNGTFSRWWTSGGTGYTTSGPTAIPTGAAGRYPFYSPTGEQRIFYLGRTAPSAGGKYAVTYNNATTSTTGLNIVDGATTITNRWDGNFLVTLDGTTPAATSNWVTMFTPGAFFTTATGASVLGQNGALSGTHVNTSNAPFGQRSGVLTADLTAATGLYLGVNAADVPVVSIASGDWNSTSTWSGGVVPTCADVAIIANGHTVTSSTSGNFAKGISIVSGGTLEVSAGDLTVGCTLNNNTLTNNGTLTVSGGLLAVNGNMVHNAASIFNQSGGEILVDGNEGGVVANSVAAATAIVKLNSEFVNWTGGVLTILDPHAGGTSTSNTIAYENGNSHVNVSNMHTLKLGDGVSTDAGGHTNGFRLSTWIGSRRILFGNLEVNTLGGTNRIVTTSYALGFSGNITIEPSSEVSFGTSYVAGNIVNNGTFTSTTLLGLANYLDGTVSATTNAQTIGGTGVYRNLATTPTANLTSLTINNTNATGVTLNVPLSVSGTLTMTSGIINTTDTNLLTLGTTTAAGTLAGTQSATNMVKGPFARTIANANTNYILFPVGKTTYAPIWAAPATTAVSVMKAETFDTNTGTQSAAISNMTTNRRWELPLVSGTINNINVRLGDAGILATSIPVQAPSASGEYTSTFGAVATAVVGVSTQSNTSVLGADYTGFLSYADSNACVGTPTPGNTIASVPTICFGDSVTFSLENLTAGSGVTYQWQSSSDGIAYSDIVGATNPTYTASPSSVTYYQCIVTCSAGPSSATSIPVQITFTNNILTTTPASRCGTGTVTLEATANAGTTIEWFANQTDQVVLATGSTFTTPSISSNTTYYVQANTGGSNYSVGALTPASQGGTQGNWTIGWSNNITVLSNTTLYSLDIFPLTSGQTGTFTVRNGFGTTGTVIATINYTTNVSGGSTAQTLLFNVPLTPGNYSIYSDVLPAAGLRRNISGATHPYTSPVANLVGNGYDNAYYMGLYNIIFKNGCSSPRVPVLATVSTPPVLTLSGTNATICSGDSSSVVTLTAGSGDYDTFVWTPATGVSGDAVTGWTFNPADTTNYTLTASQSSGALCVTSVTFDVNVNPLPTALIITPTSPTICVDGIQSLTTTGGTIGFPDSTTIGSDTTVTTQNNLDPTAFNNRYEHYWMQMVFTAAELTAAGVEPGNINGIKFNITTIGSAAFVSDYRVHMANTGLSVLTGFVTTGLTEVFAAATYNQQLGVNAITFDTPYVWDGVSNIILDIRSTGADSTNNSSTYYTATPDNKTVSAVTSSTFASSNAYAASNPAGTLSLKRLNTTFDFVGSQPTTVTWSPLTDLYTDAGATIPYTGTNASTVYVKSSTIGTQTYTATATAATTCFTTATVDVAVSALPDTTITRADDTLTVAETGATYQWYACSAGPVFTPIVGATSQSYLATAIGSYAVDVTLNGCTTRSTCFDVTTLSSNSFNLANLAYYPNPVVDKFTITYSSAITAIQVYDISGRLVKNLTTDNTEVNVDMSDVAASVYIVKVFADNTMGEFKVIKK